MGDPQQRKGYVYSPRPDGVRFTNASIVEALWREIGDPARGIGIKAARTWIKDRFDFEIPERVLGYHLKRLRDRELSRREASSREIEDLTQRVQQLEKGPDGGVY